MFLRHSQIARLRPMLLVVVLVEMSIAYTPLPAAPPTAQQRTHVRTAEIALKRAGNLYRAKKYAEAGAALKDAQASLDSLVGDESREVAALVAPVARQMARARDLLEKEGVKLPAAKASPAEAKKEADGVSFTKQIAPLLISKCGNCHIQRSRGELNMSTYVALSKGSKNGSVIMAGNPTGSRIIEVLESGDMPRGGGKISPPELALLTAWIAGGAKFDGTDSAAPLSSFAQPKKENAPPQKKVEVVAAASTDEVRYARDVGPILVAHCTECHGEQNPRNNLSFHSFNRLLQGGDSGPPVVPGQAADSLLVKKLKGLAGDRMPLNRPPLSDAEVVKIEKWIALGAKFDGPDPAMPLDETIARVIAESASHDELSRRRLELAQKNWRLILPDSRPQHEETADLLVYGNVGAERLAEATRVADEQIARLRKLFRLPDKQPLLKGRITLFVFEKRFEYGEVGTMLEHRELPATWRGHWSYSPVDAYACVVLSADGQVAPGLVAQQLTGLYLGSQGNVPRWFSEGSARAIAARFDPKDARLKAWDDQVGKILRGAEKPEAFLTGGLSPEDSDIVSYSFVKSLMTQPVRHTSLVAAVVQGKPFAEAFAKVYGADPETLAKTWAARAGKRGR